MSGYKTKSGDMWDSICFDLTGAHDHTEALMLANPQYAGVYIFEAGIELTVPDFDSIVDYEDLPPWVKE